jgi:dTMP kinase
MNMFYFTHCLMMTKNQCFEIFTAMFLVFEGLDGSGKSSLMKMLSQHLLDLSYQVVISREPGGTLLGDQLRDLILKKSEFAPCPRAELLMYQASRAQHVETIIKPALNDKKWVLCDRFSASSVAFQGGGRGISLNDVHWLNQFSTKGLSPDLTILLDLSVEESKRRREARSLQTGEESDRIESEKDDFHNRVRQGFLNLATDPNEQKRWLILDASLTPSKLFEILLNDLSTRFDLKLDHLKSGHLK